MSTKSPFGRHRDALFGPRVLQMGPQMAKRRAKGPPKEQKGSQRLPFGTHVSLFFRFGGPLHCTSGPQGSPGTLQSPKVSRNWSPGSKKRSQSPPRCSKHNTLPCRLSASPEPPKHTINKWPPAPKNYRYQAYRLSSPNSPKHRGAAVSRQRSQ